MQQIITIHLNPSQEIKDFYKGEVKPHLNLVYPFKIYNKKELKKHIQKSINGLSPFVLIMKGIKKSAKGYYLYLLVNRGKSEITTLHRRLNLGVLSTFKNPDMPRYIPHMTLQVFKSEKEINEACKNSKLRRLKFEQRINKIDLVTLNKNGSQKSIKSFHLG